MKKEAKSISCIDYKGFSSLFKALSDPNRLSILDYLCQCKRSKKAPANVKEVAGCCNVDLSVVSRHLGALRDSGILESKRDGKEVFYSINGKEIAQHLRALADYLEQGEKDHDG